MKLLFKATLLATTVATALNIPLAMAAETAPAQQSAPDIAVQKNSAFKTDDQQSAYALGASLGTYMEKLLKQQEKLGITLDKEQLITGVQDSFANKSKLTDKELEQTLQAFEGQVKATTQAKMEKDAKENASKGEAYAADFAKQKGVKKTSSGLLYQIEKQGSGAVPKESDTVVVNYKGTLVNGTEFDNSYTRGEPLTFRLDGVIPGWTEGLKHVRKGGKIKLVIPPQLAYGKNGVPGIEPNSTLLFDVELIDIKPASKSTGKAQVAEKKPTAATKSAK